MPFFSPSLPFLFFFLLFLVNQIQSFSHMGQIQNLLIVVKSSSIDASEFQLRGIWVLYNCGIISLITPSQEAVHDLLWSLATTSRIYHSHYNDVPLRHKDYPWHPVINFYFHFLGSLFSVAESSHSELPVRHCINLGQTFALALESTCKGLLFALLLACQPLKLNRSISAATVSLGPGTCTFQSLLSSGWWGIFPWKVLLHCSTSSGIQLDMQFRA